MKKKFKRIISMVLALAMVVTGLNYTSRDVMAEEGITIPTSTEVTSINAPKKAYLCDFRTGSGGFKIVFEDVDEEDKLYQVVGTDEKSFDVYVGAEKKTTVSKSGTAVDISQWGFVDGETYEITVKQVLKRTNADGVTETLESKASAVNYFTYTTKEADNIDTGVAKVYVTTTRDEKTRTHDLYKSGDKVDVKSSLVIYKADGTIDSEGSGTIKLRGNSTSSGQKKPFNIKFDSKTNVFGFGKAKKWSLLANTFDKALIRNQIGVQFHHKIMEANQEYQFTSECEPIDFYLDGHYMGAYLLLESVEAGSTRVNIDAENPDNHEILLELDMTDRDLAKDAHLDAHTTLMNMGFTINEPEGPGTAAADSNNEDHQEWLEFNEIYAAKKAYTLDYLNNLEEKIQNGGDGTLDEIGQLIDVDSFVNYYITAELFRITDVSYSSVRYFIKKSADGTEKLYAGPLWDLDLSSGNADGAAANPDNDMHAQDNPWFGALMKNKEFAARVTARFNEVLPEIKKLVSDGGTIDTVANTLRRSIDANYSNLAYNQFSIDAIGVNTGWGVDKIYTAGHHECATADEARATGNVSGSLNIYDNYDAYLNEFKSYMTGRIKYLKKQLDATDYEEVLTTVEDQMDSYAYNLARKKKATIYKNCHNEGKIEYLNDGSITTGHLPLTNSDVTNNFGSENGDSIYATIDLGNYYDASTIEQIVVQYKDGVANDTPIGKAYKVQYSIDGNSFTDVVSVDSATLDDNNRTIDDVSNQTGVVRYVRLYYPKQAQYGMHIREFAVLDTNKDAKIVEHEAVADVTNLQLTVPQDNQIGVQFDASVTDNVTYRIYLDGDMVVSNAVAGQINLLANIKTGKHKVKVEVINTMGFVSDGVEDTIKVTGPITVEDMVKDANYNIAFGTGATCSSWKEGTALVEGISKVLTDGVINNHESYLGINVNEGSNNTGYFQINLDNAVSAKSIDEIIVWYRDGRANLCPTDIGYTIQYSEDGENFYTVKTVTSGDMPDENKNQDTAAYVTTDKMSDTASPVNTVKAVRIVYNGNVGWGVQAREIAVLDKTGNAGADREQIEVSEPEVTISSDSYNTITADIKEKASQEEYTYTIYIDGKAVQSNVKAGVYTVDSIEEGNHVVLVRSNYNGAHSDGVSQNINVKTAFTFAQSTLADRLLPDFDENGNNYLRYTGIKAEASSGNAGLAIDNLAGTRWESASSDPQEIIINLGAEYTIKEIAAVWENASSKDYTIQVSTDGSQYVTVASIKDQKEIANKYDKIVLTEAVQARFIKLNGTSRTTAYGHSIWEMAVYGPDVQKEYVPMLSEPSNLSVTSYAKYTGKYILNFEPGELAESYNVYIDGELVKNISGSGCYLTSEDVKNLIRGEHDIAIRTVGTEGQETIKEAASKITIEDEVVDYNDIPQIYISTGGREISGTYFAKQPGGKADVGITIVDNTGKNKDVIDSTSDIKIRGNSTAGAEKKPYNFKLGKKQELLGMNGKAKKWSLLANAFDKTLIRNTLVMQLASAMGLDYTSECRFVDVYVNGEYSGNYLLIESVETGSGRIDISDPEDATNNDVVLEIDNNGRDAGETFHLERSGLGVLFMLGEPEFGPLEEDKITQYQDKITNTQNLIADFEETLKNDDYEAATRYVDMDSFAKFYLVNEIFRNQDFNFSSTRFYVKDNVIYAGPCWDYDLSSGNIGPYYSGEYIDGVTYNSFKAQEMVWYQYLMKNEKFKNLVAQYYRQYLPQITALYDGTMAEEGYGIDGILDRYKASFERNYISKEQLGAGWNVKEPDQADAYSYANNREWNTYDESVEFLRSWINNRDGWLREQWNINSISEDIGITGFQMTTTLGGQDNTVGIRTVYQKENTVNGQEVAEFGLIYGLMSGGITTEDMTIDSTSPFVVHKAATPSGKLEAQMGESATAEYYVLTMDTVGAYNENYMTRVYATLADGTTVYSTAAVYNVFEIAKSLYENKQMSTYTAHQALYDIVIKAVEPETVAVDYNWNQTLVNRPEIVGENGVKIEGYQMTGSLGGTQGKMGLRVVYSIDGIDAAEVGLIYGLNIDNAITMDDVTLEQAENTENPYVVSYTATDSGKIQSQMGTSATAQYYARTMDVSKKSVKAYITQYMVRAYAKLADGTVYYSDVYTYTVNDVASQLYGNNLMNTYPGHQALYDNILTVVDSNYTEIDYSWNNSLVNKK